ncbi:MAG TPA: hypothetical protein PLD86_18050, partial [Vicinamibacteria bacterium]|nr:hypothetical protein [Vicinamibacteria bacterium]
MTPRTRALGVAVLAGLSLLPALATRMAAPANHGAHGLTTGFGRGRLDLQGIVSEGEGSIDLPGERLTLTVRLSGSGIVRLRAPGVERTLAASDQPAEVRLDLPEGGPVVVESASRIRLHEIVVERAHRPAGALALLAIAGVLAVAAASRGAKPALAASVVLLAASFAVSRGTLSGTFAAIALAQLMPALAVVIVFTPLALALRLARLPGPARVSPLTALAFASSLVVTGVQFALFEQPLPMGDPAAYFEMGG